MKDQLQSNQVVILTEAEFVQSLTMFRPDERAALLARMIEAVKGGATN